MKAPIPIFPLKRHPGNSEEYEKSDLVFILSSNFLHIY
jgi:hypothetical protein